MIQFSPNRHFTHGATSCKVNLWNWDLMCALLWGLDLCCIAQSIWTGGLTARFHTNIKDTWSIVCRGVGVGGERQGPIFAPVCSGSQYQVNNTPLSEELLILKTLPWTSPGGRWLRLHASDEGSMGCIPGQGTRSHMLHLRPGAVKC